MNNKHTSRSASKGTEYLLKSVQIRNSMNQESKYHWRQHSVTHTNQYVLVNHSFTRWTTYNPFIELFTLIKSYTERITSYQVSTSISKETHENWSLEAKSRHPLVTFITYHFQFSITFKINLSRTIEPCTKKL